MPPLVQVLTFGPGDHPFSKFGHDALRLVAADQGRDDVYNFGTFAFMVSPRKLIEDFLARRLLYWLSRSSWRATEASYKADNRSITAQTLLLAPEAAQGLAAALAVNVLPQNRAYAYDYFLDNCATRVRDAVDLAVGGALHAVAKGPARLSFRDHALRLTADDVPLALALSLVLGPLTDRPIDRWLEMFLPEVLAEALRDVRVADGHGGLAPLVVKEEVLDVAARPPARRTAPDWRWPAFGLGAAVGLVGGGLLRLRARAARSSRMTRVVARAAGSLVLLLWGLVAGSLGAALALCWFGTPHLVAHDNQNLFLFLPVALLLVPFSLAWALPGRRGWWLVRGILLLGALSALVVSAAKLLSLVPFQENGLWVAFTLPVWLGLLAGAWRGPSLTAPEESST